MDDDNRGKSFFSFFFLRGKRKEERRQGRESSLSGMSGIPLIHIAKGIFVDPYQKIFSDAFLLSVHTIIID
jgi:hypothetical protein